MNLVGKIFVFLIFIMSLVFMSFAVMVYATQSNWHQEIVKPGGYKERLDVQDKQYAELEKKNDDLKREINVIKATKATALAQSETARLQMAAQTKAKEDNFSGLTTANQTATSALAVAENNLKDKVAENERLRLENKEARNNEVAQVKKAALATEKFNQVSSMVAVLTDRKKTLEDQLAIYRAAIDRNGISLEATPPKTKGEIVGTNETEQVAEISLGTNDGFQAGNQFEVFRGNLYLGRIRLVKMEKDRAVGEMIKEYKKGQILKGDNVFPVSSQIKK